MLHCARGSLKIQDTKNRQKFAICAPSHNLGYIFATKAYISNQKNLLNSDTSFTCPHNMVNFGPLMAEICWRVWGTPANFNRFRILALLLYQHRSMEGVQPNFARCLAVSWAGILYIHFGGSCPQWNFARYKIHFASKSCLLLYWQRYWTALEQWASGKHCGVQQRVPAIFGRVAITLGIGPSSSFDCFDTINELNALTLSVINRVQQTCAYTLH